MDFLDIIREKRKQSGYTQEEMARMLNIPKTNYQYIENGKTMLKACDFFSIIKILHIPLEMFQNEEIIMINKDDFYRLKESTETIKNVIDNIQNNVNISNHSVVNITFNNDHATRKQLCRVCGEPSGFYPFCKYHAKLRQEGKLKQNKDGSWEIL